MESSAAQLCPVLLSHFPECTVWSRPVIEICTRLGRGPKVMPVVLNKLMRDFKDHTQLVRWGAMDAQTVCGDLDMCYILHCFFIYFIGNVISPFHSDCSQYVPILYFEPYILYWSIICAPTFATLLKPPLYNRILSVQTADTDVQLYFLGELHCQNLKFVLFVRVNGTVSNCVMGFVWVIMANFIISFSWN